MELRRKIEDLGIVASMADLSRKNKEVDDGILSMVWSRGSVRLQKETKRIGGEESCCLHKRLSEGL